MIQLTAEHVVEVVKIDVTLARNTVLEGVRLRFRVKKGSPTGDPFLCWWRRPVSNRRPPDLCLRLYMLRFRLLI